MKCSVFIATSADGYIATLDGGVDWLDEVGKADAYMGADADMGFHGHFATIDCMVMGRNCMEKLSSFDLTPEQWPYGTTPIFVLSNTLTEAPENLRDRVEMASGGIPELVARLKSDGFRHAYIDGGAIITSFLNLKLINEMTITRAPVVLGEGLPLFGKVDKQIELADAEVNVYPNDFIQLKYAVRY